MTLSCGVLFILCAHDVYAATLAEDLLRLPLQRLPLVRRHTEEKAAQLLPTGVVTSIRTDQKNDEQTWEYCNHVFIENTVEENACLAGTVTRQIDEPDDCEHAAEFLDLVWGGLYQNPGNIPGNRLPIPHNCFKHKDDNKVYYNAETNPPGRLESALRRCWGLGGSAGECRVRHTTDAPVRSSWLQRTVLPPGRAW